MGQWLRALADLLEALGSILGSHIVAQNYLLSPVPGLFGTKDALFWLPHGSMSYIQANQPDT